MKTIPKQTRMVNSAKLSRTPRETLQIFRAIIIINPSTLLSIPKTHFCLLF